DPHGEVAVAERPPGPVPRAADDLAERDRLGRHRRGDVDADHLGLLEEAGEGLARRGELHRVRGADPDDHRTPPRSAAARMCSGPAPQQPPTTRAPAATRARIHSANAPGRTSFPGSPPLGQAERGRSLIPDSRFTAATAWSSEMQLTP